MKDQDTSKRPTRRLRVAHIIHSLGAGGAEAVLVELVEPARRAGIDLVVIGLSDAEDNRTAVRLDEAGATVYQLHASRYDLRAVERVRKILVREHVVLVHTHLKHADLVGGLAAQLAKVPAVSTLHVIESEPTDAAHRARVRAAVLARDSFFARIIALSTAQRNWYSSISGADGDRVVLLPNGVGEPAPVKDRATVRAELGIDDATTLAVTVSLMRPEKGHAVLLDAIRAGDRRWGPMVFALAGDGPLLDQLRADVAADEVLSRRVRVLGFRTDIDELLQAADLVVHPSLADALPTALISALAAGRPVVASSVGGIGDIIAPGCGVLVPPSDPTALAEAISGVVADADSIHGVAGRARYEDVFAADVWAGRLRDLYDQVLSERTRRAPARPPLALVPIPESDNEIPTLADQWEEGPVVRRAAVISAVTLSPADNGKSVVINGFLRHLVDRLGAENVHYLHIGTHLTEIPADLAGLRVHELGRPGRRDLVGSALVHAGLRRRSLQESFTASPAVATAVRWTLASIDADLEVIDTVRMAQHVRPESPTRARRVLYLDDLFSVRYQRMLEVLENDDSGFDPLGQFSGFIPRPLQFLTRQRISRDTLLRIEARRVARSERRAARDSDLPLLLNHHEADQLEREIGVEVAVVPPLLTSQEVKGYHWSGRPDFAFVGLLSIPHNHDGVVWFLEEVLPRLLELRPDARLHLIGRGAGGTLEQAAHRWPNHVILHGFVNDLDAALSGMAALITPLRFGSGIKIKTLDALARGLPVVTTGVGAEGIVAQSRPGIRIADDPAEFAAELAALADPDHHRRESVGATSTFTELFAPEPVKRVYDRVFGTSPRLASTAASSPSTQTSGEK